ncbi:MAG: hypothetical protein ACLP3C_15645 [Mycobacterium sp.]|uniref:hypothetical protein n=1 Tax=Mycobacterium sp. TaxID=1785 RepID=UPI003F9A58CF
MSSYGNHVWTQDRHSAARKLVEAAMDCDDDGFAETLHSIAGISAGWPFGDQAAPMHTADPAKAISELLAVTALLAEQLAQLSDELTAAE